jgi:TonB family protein
MQGCLFSAVFRRNILLLFLLICFSPLHAQRSMITFYDSAWLLTTRKHAVYYRAGIVDTVAYKFHGPVNEFYRSGKPLMKGTFRANIKQDTFYFYYPTGKLETKGTYRDDIRKGTWTNYYGSGAIKEKVLFDDAFVSTLDSFDENGKPNVVNGTGLWRTDYLVTPTLSQVVEGAFENGQRQGTWTYWLVDVTKSDTTLECTETYKHGKFVTGKVYTANRSPEKISQPRKIVFPEFARFAQWGMWRRTAYPTQLDYPYLKFLAKDSTGVVMVNVEKPAEFKGGLSAMAAFVNKNLQYPKGAPRNGMKKKVDVSFVIDKDGSIIQESVTVVRSDHPSLDEEAIRLVKSFPPWNPGTQNGKAVRCRFVLPVMFGR